MSLAASVCGKEKTTDYLFATFLGDGGPAGQQVCMSVSHDGNHWFDLNDRRPILDVSDAKTGDRGVRDPFMIRNPEALFVTDPCSRRMDFYERVLFNHVLATHDNERAMTDYFTQLFAGAYRVYGDPFDSFWCCTGTGLEVPGKYGQMVYTHSPDDSEVSVQLFAPSTLDWKKKGVRLVQTTDFPFGETVKVVVETEKPVSFTMKMRKHIKVEPRRYYALCDKMGIMVLQDMPSGVGHVVHRYAFHRLELKRMMDHLMNVPSIVMWVPYNEGWSQPSAKNTMDTLAWVKRYDPTRLVDGPSGWHDFEDGRIRDHKTFVAHSRDMHRYPGPEMHPLSDDRASFLGEYGGIGFVVKDHVWNRDVKGWGYATDDNLERSFSRYAEIMKNLAFLARKGLAGSVYTQTTDVELEINGLLTYDRKVCKYPVAELRKLHEAVYAAADAAANNVSRDVTIVTARDAASDAWSYTFDTPMGDWVLPGFDDSSWKKSAAGFGHRNIANEIKGTMLSTVWETPNIYLRKTFDFGGDPAAVEVAWAEVFHDDNCDLYLNGYPILVKEGHTDRLVDAALDMKAFKKALKKGRNVLAAHCRQFGGGQYFDAGIKATMKK